MADAPRALGLFGGLVAVLALELIAPELAFVLACVRIAGVLRRRARGARRAPTATPRRAAPPSSIELAT
jgi:hypothetical protein